MLQINFIIIQCWQHSSIRNRKKKTKTKNVEQRNKWNQIKIKLYHPNNRHHHRHSFIHPSSRPSSPAIQQHATINIISINNTNNTSNNANRRHHRTASSFHCTCCLYASRTLFLFWKDGTTTCNRTAHRRTVTPFSFPQLKSNICVFVCMYVWMLCTVTILGSITWGQSKKFWRTTKREFSFQDKPYIYVK